MKKKTVNLAVSLGVLAVVCAAYAGVKQYTAKMEQEEKGDEEEKEEVTSFSSDEITSVKFLIDKKEVTFEKKEDQWQKSDENEFPVNQDVLTEAVGGLSFLEADRVLEDVDSLSEYGLDQPTNTITITTSDEARTVLSVGMENDSTSQYYVKKDGDASRVYVVENSAIQPFLKTLYDYTRQGTFPSIDSTMVQKVQAEKGGSAYSLVKDQDTSLWEIEDEDGREKADSAKAESLISTLTSLSYQSFVDYHCEDLSEYGLEKPYGTITVDYQEEIQVVTEDGAEESSEELEESASQEEREETEDSDSEEPQDTEDADSEEEETKLVDRELVILIGNQGENNTRYVKVGDSKEIYTISEESLSAIIGKQKADFWDLTVHYLSSNQLEQLKVIYGKEYTIDVSRETSQETEEDSDSSPVTTLTYTLDGKELDSVKFTTFYNKVNHMAGQKRLTEEYKPSGKGEMTITFLDTDGITTEVSYYPYDANFYAAVKREKVYLVNKMAVKEMMEAFEEVLEG